jgi:glutaredoxin
MPSPKPSPLRHSPCSAAVLAAVLMLAALPAQAQYKVVGPDGRVTYTDRPPTAASAGQVTPLRRDGAAAPVSNAVLPLELRQTAARFPVTLYTAPDCNACDSGRRLLQARGVPYAEKLVKDDADLDALAKLSDGRDVPVLTVGKQLLRGFSDGEWQNTLDLATYPRESRLPRNYVQPAATPLTPKAAPAPAPVQAAPAPAPAPKAAPPDNSTPAGPNIRF